MRLPLLISCSLALWNGSVQAQFLNRAVWLGREEEGIRRTFRQGTEYFLDRMSYVVAPPWWDRGLQRFGNEFRYRLGSVTSSDFTVEGHLNHAIALGDGVSFRYHFLQGEHRDARFLRNAIGFEYATSESTALFAQGTPLADKEKIDVSVGAWLFREDDDALRVMLTLVDGPGDKAEDFEFEQAPIGLHLAGAFGDRDSHRIAFELGAQLPFELRQLEDDSRFEMERFIGTVSTHLKLSARDWLVGEVEVESTSKSLRPLLATDPQLEQFDRSFVQARIEWWRDGPRPWSIGLLHTYHSEHGHRPNDPANDLRTLRREWMGIARVQLPVNDKLSFEPQLLAGTVANRFYDGMPIDDDSGFQGKISWNARWDFSPGVTLAITVSTQLDELAFGGGGALFEARF